MEKHPGRTPEPAADNTSHETKTAPNVRVIGAQRGAVDARAAGSRRDGAKNGTRSDTPANLQSLDRSIEPDETARNKEHKAPGDAQQQEQDVRKSVAEQQDAQKKQADTRKQEQRQRDSDSKKQITEQQQAARERMAECERQAKMQHRDVLERLSETPPQQNRDTPNTN